MEEEYDVIICGTGLKECILSGLLTTQAKSKVLQMDKNNYYGGESASLHLGQLFEKFLGEDAKVPEEFGRIRDYNIDLCPKFIMACGNLVKLLLSTGVTRYLEFKSVEGSYVYKGGKVHKVPSTPTEALASSLMGMFQKRYYKNFVNYVNGYDVDDEKTWKKKDLSKTSCLELMKYWNLDDNTIAFTGHAVALYTDDEYLKQPAGDMIERIKLYAYSVARYGNSPYIYPVWGLGGLPEGFSRLAAVHGGVFMLNQPISKLKILKDDEGKVKGVENEKGEKAFCKKLICSPDYVQGTDKVKKVGRVVRFIGILSHPLDNTYDAKSCQIILPFKHTGRKSDIYISVVSDDHQVVAKNRWVAIIQAKVEGNSDDEEKIKEEILPALKLLGKIDREFFWVSDYYVPTDNGTKDNIYVTSSYDETSHFESTTLEVMKIYKDATGQELDLSIPADLNQDE